MQITPVALENVCNAGGTYHHWAYSRSWFLYCLWNVQVYNESHQGYFPSTAHGGIGLAS